MENRVKLNNGKSSILKTPTLPSTYDAFKTACENGVQFVDISPNDDLDVNPGVSVVGTALNEANLLSDATAVSLGLTAAATPDDAFAEISKAIEVVNTVTFAQAGWSTSGTGYTQTVNVSGISADSKPTAAIYFSAPTNESLCKAEAKAAACVRRFTTSAGAITATASKMPQTTFYVQFRGA